MLSPNIETNRLILRRYNEIDLDAFYEILHDERLHTYIPFPDLTKEEELEYIKNCMAEVEESKYEKWSIVLKNENITAIIVTHDISEAISMSDRIVVLTKRPATVKTIHTIDFKMENRNPINCRESPKFSKYFDAIWKELDVHV